MLAATRTSSSPKHAPQSAGALDGGDAFLSVIIVSYHVKEFLEQTLASVRRAVEGLRSEIIVVDNASRDGSVELVRQHFPEVRLIANGENVGFARACNQGLRLARGNFLTLLNPDTLVQEDTFTSTIAFFREHPDTGLLGCKILNPDGTLQLACRRSYPTPWVALTKMIGLSRLFPRSRLFGRYNLTYLDPDQTCEVEAISGSFMMIQRPVLETVGYLDEDFFMYGEDLDWCYRIHQGGWKVRYFPGTQIVHFKGESSKRSQFDSLRQFYQAMVLFVKKHFRRRYLFLPYWLILGAIWLKAGLSFVKEFLLAHANVLTDLVLLMVSLLVALYVRFESLTHMSSFLPVHLAYSAIWLACLGLFGCYNKYKFSSSKAATAVFVGFLINASLTYFFKQYAFSRAVVLLAGMLSLVFLPGWRFALKLLARVGIGPFKGTLGKTLLSRRALVVGDFQNGEELLQRFNAQVDTGYRIAGLVSTQDSDVGRVYEGLRVLGSLDQLHSIVREQRVQEVIFSTRRLSYDRILDIISRSGDLRVNFKLVPSNLEVIIGKASIDRINDLPLLEIDYRLHQGFYRFAKRLFDLALAGVLTVVTAPVVLYKLLNPSSRLTATLVRGADGRPFVLHSFSGREGRFVNQLPALWAILRGDLSFVGGEIVTAEPENDTAGAPLVLKPGLTGLIQVNRRQGLTQEDKEKYNLYYLKNYSVLLDVEILFKHLFNI